MKKIPALLVWATAISCLAANPTFTIDAGHAAGKVSPLLYGLMGFVGSLIGASLFNLAAGWVGGIELETQ